MGQGAADVGGELGFLAGAGSQNILHEIAEGTAHIPLEPGGADAHTGAEQPFQRPCVLHPGRGPLRRAAHGGKAGRRLRGALHRPERRLDGGAAGGVLLPLTAQQVQRGAGGSRQIRRVNDSVGHGEQLQHRGQRGTHRKARCTARPAHPEQAAGRSEGFIKADLFPDDAVLKAVRQIGALGDHGVPVSVGQQTGIPGRLGELPLRQAQHKNRLGLGQPHPARRGEDDAVHALGDMAQIGGPQEKGEQVIVLCRRDRGIPRHQPDHLVQKLRHNVPFPQCLVGAGQIPLAAQFPRQRLNRLRGAKLFQKKVDAAGHLLHVGVPAAVHQLLDFGDEEAPGRLGVFKIRAVLIAEPVGVARRIAGKGLAPVPGTQRPGVGVVFQRAEDFLFQIHQAGFDQTQNRAGADPAAQQFQRRMDRAGRGRVFRRGGLIAEQWNALQAKFIPDRRQIGFGGTADDRHFAVGNAGAGFCLDGGRHRFCLLLAAVGAADHNGRVAGIHRRLRRIGRVSQKQGQFRQSRGIPVAQILGQVLHMAGHPRTLRHRHQAVGHPARSAEQTCPALALLQTVAAQSHRHIGYRQHGGQHGTLGVIEGIKFINVHRTARKKFRFQHPGRAAHPVAGVHGSFGQKALVAAVDQRQFPQFVPVGAGRCRIGGQRLGTDAGAFQFVDGLGGFLTERRAAALTAVIHHLVHHLVQCAAHQHRTARLGEGGNRRAAVAPQQRFGQGREGIALHIS